MNPVLVIFAPTASGKTALAEKIFAKDSLSVFKGKGEVISADSQAVYRGCDIGTAKPDRRLMELLPHHLIDIKDPDEQFDCAEFFERADKACREIQSRGHFPVVAGGSGFYIRNFLFGLPQAPVSLPNVHEKNVQLLEKLGSEVLHSELEILDPLSSARINPHDGYRIVRALDVFFSSGRPLSSYRVSEKIRPDHDFLILILMRDREELYRRIDERVEQMFSDGLPDEFNALRAKGYGPETPAMKAIGYSEFFREDCTLDEIKELIKKDSRRYAKKQYTYMKEIPGARYVDASDTETVIRIISDFCSSGSFQLS